MDEFREKTIKKEIVEILLYTGTTNEAHLKTSKVIADLEALFSDHLVKAQIDSIESGRKAGIQMGSLEEAGESLRRRFTTRELDALVSLFWFSDPMQSIRNDIAKLKESMKDLNDDAEMVG